ncbi:MAG: hypothetical protein LBU23_01440, partial [Planctomycetota bacterium]|nr:hypothetical protein [Planctomycetota bacterium]
MPDQLTALLVFLRDALKAAVPEVGGKVYLRRNLPRQGRDAAFIQISLGDGTVETQDRSPPVALRTATVNIAPVARGDTEAAYLRVLALRAGILRIMREMQRVLDSALGEDDPPLVEEIRPTAESEIAVQG